MQQYNLGSFRLDDKYAKQAKRPRLMAVILLALLLIGGPPFIRALTEDDNPETRDASFWSELQEFWVFRLLLNVLGYGSIILPGYLLIRWIKTSGYLERAGSGPVANFLRLFAEGMPPEKVSVEEGGVKAEVQHREPTFLVQALKLLFCAAGLLTFYLTWGLLQERIMAFKYGATDTDEGENFKNSQFLVFVNRILALVVAVIIINVKKQPRHVAPMYKYSFSSISNIMSSWFQYEALKFVSFPVQVLAKASKVIPVMLMGKIVSKRTYDWHEYLTAVMISMGVGMFLLTSRDAVRGDGPSTTFSGVIILLGYLGFDAFTSNWQGEIFKSYKVSSFQMMAGVNFFSVIFTAGSLLEQGGFMESLAFMARHPTFMWHSVILSICSAVGQLFIFYTISQFGPVTFTIIMTIRQGFAILLSCIIYHHPVTIIGIFGILIVFTAMFIRIQCGRMSKKNKKPAGPTIDIKGPTSVVVSAPKA